MIAWGRGSRMPERLRSVLRGVVCALFGECWRPAVEREENNALRARVEALEQQVQFEKSQDGWRPVDVFRIR